MKTEIDLLRELNQLDRQRIRPVSEGDTEFLKTLNEKAIALREELVILKAEGKL